MTTCGLSDCFGQSSDKKNKKCTLVNDVRLEEERFVN